MNYLNNSMSLEIDDVNCVLRNIKNDNFFFIDHSKEVYDVFILMFPENIPILIQMYDTLLLTWMVNSHQNKGVIIGRRYTKNLLHLMLEIYPGHIF